MNPFEPLLVTQDHDTRLDQLAHQRENLPEIAVVAEAETVLVTSQAAIDAASERLDELQRAQRLAEDTLASLEAKLAEIEGQLYGGGVSNPRELQDLQTELDSVKRRISTAEDEVLAGMEAIEPATATLAEATTRHEAVLGVKAQAEADLTAASAEIDAEADEVRAQRAASIQGVPDDVVADYERRRAALSGVAIARLEQGRCGGCHLMLASAELDRIRHLDPAEVVHCEECGRILVR